MLMTIAKARSKEERHVKSSHPDYCGARNLCRRIGYSDGNQFGHGPGFRRSWEERGSEFISPRQNRKKSRQKRWRGNGFLVIVGRLSPDIVRQVVKYPAMDCSIGVFPKETPFAFIIAVPPLNRNRCQNRNRDSVRTTRRRLLMFMAVPLRGLSSAVQGAPSHHIAISLAACPLTASPSPARSYGLHVRSRASLALSTFDNYQIQIWCNAHTYDAAHNETAFARCQEYASRWDVLYKYLFLGDTLDVFV